MAHRNDIPDKMYFKIGEVAEITRLPAYVLRFWETEFSKIRPKRTASGQRLYKRSDIELLLTIKNLLYERKFTIEGAKKHLAPKRENQKSALNHRSVIEDVRRELQDIRKLLD